VSTTYAADLASVRAAAARIAPFVHRTPVMTSRQIDAVAGRTLFFKCENLQRIGAFKMRGAVNAVMSLPDDVARRGVVTHSSGNFAQALALAARERGIDAHIVMPRTAPAVKREATQGYGARVYECEPNQVAREHMAASIVERTGGTLIPPYDHPDIIAGQGTATLELLEEIDGLDAVIAPVGGGGLVAGMCVTARAWQPAVRCFAGEPKGADDARRSMDTGVRQPAVSPPKTIADGLLTGLGELTWPIIRDQVEAIITVTDDQIRTAMRLVWERMKLVVEPSGAVGLAAVLDDAFRKINGIHKIGIVFSGGNVSLDKLFGQQRGLDGHSHPPI
jgi:threonine dehydratase/serine racemase